MMPLGSLDKKIAIVKLILVFALKLASLMLLSKKTFWKKLRQYKNKTIIKKLNLTFNCQKLIIELYH